MKLAVEGRHVSHPVSLVLHEEGGAAHGGAPPQLALPLLPPKGGLSLRPLVALKVPNSHKLQAAAAAAQHPPVSLSLSSFLFLVSSFGPMLRRLKRVARREEERTDSLSGCMGDLPTAWPVHVMTCACVMAPT